MNITILARSPPAGFFLCPKSSNKQGEELMNDIFENTETMKENEHSYCGSSMICCEQRMVKNNDRT